MKPIIFLDIDGVLNSTAFFLTQPWAIKRDQLDPTAVKLLDELIIKLDAQVVISSTWRILLSLDYIKGRLAAAGLDSVDRVIGVTPRLPYQRGDEIQAWLEKHAPEAPFVILDDNSDMAGVSSRLVKTTHDRGLEPIHVERALALLKGQTS